MDVVKFRGRVRLEAVSRIVFRFLVLIDSEQSLIIERACQAASSLLTQEKIPLLFPSPAMSVPPSEVVIAETQ